LFFVAVAEGEARQIIGERAVGQNICTFSIVEIILGFIASGKWFVVIVGQTKKIINNYER
jgi:hypothetical protein